MGDRIKVYLEGRGRTVGGEPGAQQAAGQAPADQAAQASGAESIGEAGAGAASGEGAGSGNAAGAASKAAGKMSATPGKKKPSAAESAAIAAVRLTDAEKQHAAEAQAAGLRRAAAKGVPFCEECERARQALKAQGWGKL